MPNTDQIINTYTYKIIHMSVNNIYKYIINKHMYNTRTIYIYETMQEGKFGVILRSIYHTQI